MPSTTEARDDALIGYLREDGRASYSEMSRALGIPRAVVRERIQTLVAEKQLTIAALVDPSVLGLQTLCHLAVDVSGSPALVAQRIAEFKETSLVAVTNGRHSIVAEIRASNSRNAFEICSRVRALRGVVRVAALTYMEVHKSPYSTIAEAPRRKVLDGLDESLIELLEEDGRMRCVELADRLGLPESTVRVRLRRLIADNVMRVRAVARRDRASRTIAMGIGISTSGRADQLTTMLCEWKAVEFVATCLGAFDLVATISAPSLDPLLEVVNQIHDDERVSAVDTWLHMSILKEAYHHERRSKLPRIPAG